MYNPCPVLQEFMWHTMPLLQLHLYNQYPDWYEMLVQREKVAAKLKVMRFASVSTKTIFKSAFDYMHPYLPILLTKD
jgi:hypothetical protein